MTLHKKPIQRAIDAVIRLGGRTLHGTFYTNDFGGHSHRLEGFFGDDLGAEWHAYGELSGFQFKPVQKGRPKGDSVPLDVGLTLCHRWHQYKGSGNKPKDRADASGETLSWWHANGWPGASDEQALNKRMRAGWQAMQKMAIQRHEPDDPREVATLIAAPASATTAEVVGDSIRVTVDGRGWLWRSDYARAKFGRIRCEYTLEQPTQAAITALGICQG